MVEFSPEPRKTVFAFVTFDLEGYPEIAMVCTSPGNGPGRVDMPLKRSAKMVVRGPGLWSHVQVISSLK